MNLKGIGVRIWAENVEVLYDFYTEKLGFKVNWGERGWPYVSFVGQNDGTDAFSIFTKHEMSGYDGYLPLSVPNKSDQAVLVVGCDDVDATYEELKNKGVEFVGKPRNIWGMRCVNFRDPEGNLFEIFGPEK